MLRKTPLIVILGSTGTGKTKLSIELAERYCGEIISADSMQVYSNLDIATAKATKEEQARVKHHLLDVTTPDEPFTVINFRDAALPIIEELLGKSKFPIVVGGTNYYIESLLWETLVNTKVFEEQDSKADKGNEAESGAEEDAEADVGENRAKVDDRPYIDPAKMEEMASDVLHKHLKEIDPDSANRIHPNNKRKIVRAIEVYQLTGQTLTETYKAQRAKPGGNRLGGPLRYPHTILFWLRCDQEVLDKRLEQRIDNMLERGLLKELRAFHNENKIDKSKSNEPLTYTRGVLQTIGFKEFVPYLEQYNETNDRKIEDYLRLNGYKMPIADKTPGKNKKTSQAQKLEQEEEAVPKLPPGIDLLSSCLDDLKLVTRRYSRKQIKWINNRLLACEDRQVPDLYELDTSDVSKWQTNVLERARTIVDSYLKGVVCEIQPIPKRKHPTAGLNEEVSNYCVVCERHFIGEYQWNLHIKSNNHKRKRAEVRQKELTEATAQTTGAITQGSGK